MLIEKIRKHIKNHGQVTIGQPSMKLAKRLKAKLRREKVHANVLLERKDSGVMVTITRPGWTDGD